MSKRAHTVLTLKVVIPVPEGSNSSAVMDYVRVAIKSHAGGMDPENPLFNIDREAVTVSLMKRETIYA